MMSLPGLRALAQDRARRFSHSARAASIRHATVLGSLLAFVVLCVLSVRVNAAPVVDAGTLAPVSFAHNPRAVAALSARDAVATRAQAGEDFSSRDAAVAARESDVIPATEASLLRDQVAMGAHRAAMVWCGLLTSLLVLAALTLIALGGWCRARGALKQAADKLRGAESEWQRRYIAIEEREQAARAVAARHAAAQERERIFRYMRHFVAGPLSALAGLFEALEMSTMPRAQKPLVGKIQSAVRTYGRALEDMLAPEPVESCAVMLDESPTDLRELIDGVVALFSLTAAQRGLYLSVSIDRSIAPRILVDGARLGQIVFHLVSDAVRSSGRGQITVAARAEPLNAGAQRIFVCVRDVGAVGPDNSIQAQLPWLFSAGAPVETCNDHGDASFALCRQIAQRMGGELTVRSAPGFGTKSMFSAPFAIELPNSSTDLEHGDSRGSARSMQRRASVSSETFDPSYLRALSEEGIDLSVFARGWHKSIVDDLEQLRNVCDRHDISGLRASLHRLSGAVGLVGAGSLMEALRRASVAQPEPEVAAIDALVKRIATLMTQLDAAIEPQRSNLP